MKTLLAIGDSFTYGEELEDRTNAWPSLVAKNLGWEVVNLGQPGSSNDRIVRVLMEQNLDNFDAVAIGWTHFDRIELADEVGVYDAWAGGKRTKQCKEAPFRKTITKYISRHHNDDFLYHRYMSYIVLVQCYLTCYNIPYVMMDAFENPTYPQRYKTDLWHQVDEEKFIGWPTSTMCDWCKDVEYGPVGHFLDEGHKIVAEKVLKCLMK